MIPQDGAMLYSYINMKLRDSYSSLEDLCYDLHLDMDDIIDRLGDEGYYYDEALNRFAPL